MSAAAVDSVSTRPRTPIHLWIVGVLSLLWGLMGVVDYTSTVTHWEPYLSQVPQETLDYVYSFPPWMFVVWALGVFGGFFGAVGLLLRKKWAVWMFAVALVGAVGSAFCPWIVDHPTHVTTPGEIAFATAIVVITILLLLYARAMARRGVLR